MYLLQVECDTDQDLRLQVSAELGRRATDSRRILGNTGRKSIGKVRTSSSSSHRATPGSPMTAAEMHRWSCNRIVSTWTSSAVDSGLYAVLWTPRPSPNIVASTDLSHARSGVVATKDGALELGLLEAAIGTVAYQKHPLRPVIVHPCSSAWSRLLVEVRPATFCACTCCNIQCS